MAFYGLRAFSNGTGWKTLMKLAWEPSWICKHCLCTGIPCERSNNVSAPTSYNCHQHILSPTSVTKLSKISIFQMCFPTIWEPNLGCPSNWSSLKSFTTKHIIKIQMTWLNIIRLILEYVIMSSLHLIKISGLKYYRKLFAVVYLIVIEAPMQLLGRNL